MKSGLISMFNMEPVLNARNYDKYKPSNNIFPGIPPPGLPELLQIEEMLISLDHALSQLWQVCGGQFKYTWHTCNFPQEISVFHHRLPLLPEDCNIIIIHHAGLEHVTNLAIYQDFHVH